MKSILLTALLCLAMPALAQTKEGPPTLSLDAQSKVLISNDEMQITFAIEREGNDLAAMNQAVLQALNSAIADAKKADGVKAKIGSVYTNPNWTPQGKPNGYRVRGEVSLNSQNFAAISALSGQLSQRLQLAGVNFRLSDETKTNAERQLIRSAAAAFRAKAQEAAVALGFKGFEMKDINLNNAGNVIVRQQTMMKSARSSDAMSAAAVPSEGGESEVIVTFSGTVNLK
jgi:predicted secreted protein